MKDNYQVIAPPFTLKFDQMSKKELDDYFVWYLAQIPQRIAILEKTVKHTLGFHDWKADHGPESLKKLGEWFKKQVETRKRTDEEIRQKTAGLGWPANQIEIPRWELTNRTFSLAVDIGMYLSQVFLKNIRGIDWEHDTKRSKRWIDYGQPVLSGFGGDVFNPTRMTVTSAYGLAKGTWNEDHLFELYHIWKRFASTERPPDMARDYPMIAPPFTLKFDQMTRKELDDYFIWYLGQIPQRIVILEKTVKHTPGFQDWEADYSPESLDKLGEWFVEQIQTCERTDEEIAAMKAGLSWPASQIEIPRLELTNRTFSLAFDIGMYLSQVLFKNIPGLKWDHKTKGSKRWIEYGQPILAGWAKSDAFNPTGVVVSVAYSFARRERSEKELREIFEYMEKQMH